MDVDLIKSVATVINMNVCDTERDIHEYAKGWSTHTSNSQYMIIY